MRERDYPVEESRRDQELREESERKLEDTERTRREFYMPYSGVPGEVPPRSDSDIARDVERALFYDELVKSYEIRTVVSDGNVTLSGTVDDGSTRRIVEDLVKRVPGVKGITNNIQVRGMGQG